MKKLLKTLLIALLAAVLLFGMHWWIDQDRWAWYDAGYDDALNDLGIVYIDGEMITEGACPLPGA
jgi:hypothetical protein